MTIFKEQYTFSPAKFVLEKKPEWIDHIKPEVSKIIETLKTQLVEEAEHEHEEDLLTREYMYTCFKQNVEEHGYFSNWVILKYFSRILTIKILKEMIGEWTYTEEDIKMYNYFATLKVDCNNKASLYKFRFETGIGDITYKSLHQFDPDKIIYGKYETDDITASNVFAENYYRLFYGKFNCVEDLLRRAKLQSPIKTINTDFTDPDYYIKEFGILVSTKYNTPISFSCEKLKSNWEIETSKKDRLNYNKEEFYNKVNEYINADPIYNKLKHEERQRYKELLNEFTETDIGKKFMEYIPDLDVQSIYKFIK